MTSHVLLFHLFLAMSHVVLVVPHVEVFQPERESYQHILPSQMSSKNASEHTIYGIMFDAGSTGTRIHIYTFVQKAPGHPPELEGEVFESVKPGLSAYVDQPEQCAESVRGLLEIAKDAVPPSHWKSTPVVLMATAGLRLLPEKKAQALLTEVKEIFEDSPFLVTDNCVGIMNGTYEGILGWITVNFLTGQLYGERSQTFGTLDLGGASTQITFLPEFEETVEQAPRDFLTSFEMFDSTYSLYTHSYLGLGLKAARLATLGVSAEGGVIEQRLHSSCLPQGLEAEWVFAGVNYHYGGKPDGETGFKACYAEVLKIVQGKLHQPEEIQGRSFYAFSYYYDRAVDTNLIDYETGGALEVRDFKRKAKEVCNHMDRYTSHSPFLCMDLCYITALLKEGFGFKDSTVLQLTKKVNNVETSWTLGATFHLMQSLDVSH